MQIHRGILLNRIPIDGVPGAIYMLQFLVWALVSPAVCAFYAVLLLGGLLLAPVIHYLNRLEQCALTSMRGGVVGFLAGVAFLASVSEPRFHLPEIVAAMVVCGGGLSILLTRMNSGGQYLSVKPYA